MITRLSGDAFKSCLVQVFEGIRFEPPVSGKPTVVSYSLFFKPKP